MSLLTTMDKEGNRLLAQLPEANPFPVLRLSYQGEPLYMNPATRRFAEDIGCDGPFPALALPGDYLRTIQRLIDQDTTLVEAPHEYQGRSLLFTYRPLSEMQQIFVTIVDVTERVRAEEKIRSYAAALEEKNLQLREAQLQLVQSEKLAAMGALVAGVAHEMNTPVGSIRSGAETSSKATAIIRKAFSEGEETAALLDRSPRLRTALTVLEELSASQIEASDRITRIVDSMRNFVRLDEGEFKRVSVVDGLDNTLALLQHRLEGTVEVHRRFDEVPPILCYPVLLNQVFMHLLVNAIDSMEVADAGAPGAPRLTLRCGVEGRWVVIRIADTGGGISGDDLPRVFDPGFTTRGPGVGTGFGLSISYRIMQKHEGEISIDSAPGQGTTVTLRLPAS